MLVYEYMTEGRRLTVKTEVYSFGVVLLEIFLGKDAVKKYPNGLAGMWAKPYLSNKQELHRAVDQRLGKNIRMEEAQEFAQIILRCLSLEPKTTPTMTQVVADLEQLELPMGGNWDFLRLSKCPIKEPPTLNTSSRKSCSPKC
ncbi:probable serine/threonine-protein kinase PBL9 [Mangifera indica]|uniref:probable serine/threonine-protein kinase PBL9 n=1 Tax=Mangifera indica TaxID=29780 RepID=UPI001CF94378|nr:probable serine/threonine-protein kinase PBL9 [Mangifera indica]